MLPGQARTAAMLSGVTLDPMEMPSRRKATSRRRGGRPTGRPASAALAIGEHRAHQPGGRPARARRRGRRRRRRSPAVSRIQPDRRRIGAPTASASRPLAVARRHGIGPTKSFSICISRKV